MIVVSNASPLLSLAQADCLHVLEALFGRVLIPAAVYRETVEQCPVPALKRPDSVRLQWFHRRFGAHLHSLFRT